jgi:hypothetical protein
MVNNNISKNAVSDGNNDSNIFVVQWARWDLVKMNGLQIKIIFKRK